MLFRKMFIPSTKEEKPFCRIAGISDFSSFLLSRLYFMNFANNRKLRFIQLTSPFQKISEVSPPLQHAQYSPEDPDGRFFSRKETRADRPGQTFFSPFDACALSAN